MRVHTIGYEGMELHAYVALLAKQGVRAVAEVRKAPISWKRGFSRNALSEAQQGQASRISTFGISAARNRFGISTRSSLTPRRPTRGEGSV